MEKNLKTLLFTSVALGCLQIGALAMEQAEEREHNHKGIKPASDEIKTIKIPSTEDRRELGSVKLVKRTLRHQGNGKEKPCFLFVDEENNLIHGNSDLDFYDLVYDTKTLESHLLTTQNIYNTVIQKLQENAYVALKPTLAKHIDENIIRTLLKNYLDDEFSTDREINVTGSPLSTEELGELNHYIKLCNAVYTNSSTRNFVMQQHLPNIEKKLNSIIQMKKNITMYRRLLEKIREKDNQIMDIDAIFIKTGSKITLSEQVESIETETTIAKINKEFNRTIEKINKYLPAINKQIINKKNIEYIDQIIQKLNNIQLEINNEFFWYFDEIPEDTRTWMREVGEKLEQLFWTKYIIPKFKDLNDEKRQLTAKAVVASAFLSKGIPLADDNITILDVGFRNQESFGTLWNDFMTRIAGQVGKSNPKAWFQNWGEVDYIAYIEKDPFHKKDKLVITYSGSNSAMDWGINFTIGHNPFFGLSVHQGIGWLFQTSINTYHNVLMERINNYYRYHERPEELEIVTTGHSLGGALATLAAYYYKTTQLDYFKKIINSDKVSVKAFTFAAPAIVDENSKETVERTLGKNNIYRVWHAKDIVVNVTDDAPLQRGVHAGKSFPLYNIQNLTTDYFDWWGPHGANYYICYLHALKQPYDYSQYKGLTSALNDYIQKNGLDIYKKNLRDLNSIINSFKPNSVENFPDSFTLSRFLATDIMKYSPTTVKPVPAIVVEEINLKSPRYRATSPDLSTIDKESKVIAKFKIGLQDIEFPIHEKTNCSTNNIIEFLKRNHITYDNKMAEKFSCACFMAKYIFISKSTNTLAIIFSECIRGKASTPEYLQVMSAGRNELETIRKILKAVGLHEKFNKKQINQVISERNAVVEERLSEVELDGLIRYPQEEYKKFIIPQQTNNQAYKKIIELILSNKPNEQDISNSLNNILNEQKIKKLFKRLQKPEDQFENFAENLKNTLIHIQPTFSKDNIRLNQHLKKLKDNVIEYFSWRIKENPEGL